MASNFEELKIWQQAHQLTLKIYDTTNSWPKSETYGLISQIRRAAVSVELNIAEGQSRYHDKETIHFMYDARASAQEVRNCLMIVRDLKEMKFSNKDYQYFNEEYIILIKGINGFINYLRNKKTN